MPHFARAHRVQIVCPAGNLPLRQATFLIISTLTEEDDVRRWGGFTYSSVMPPLFEGQFWDVDESDSSRGEWIVDQNTIITIDIRGETRAGILSYFTRLRDRVAAIYRGVGEDQKALWITVQPLGILCD